MTQPVVSLCIPTYKRAPYLRCLLEDLHKNIGQLKHSYEIVIADNASPDETETVVKEFSGKLNIRYVRREQNFGAHDNWALLKKLAAGTIQLFVADDDLLVLSELSAILDQMLADSTIGVVFAPWAIYDRVANKNQGNFYRMEEDTLIEQNDYEKLLTLIFKNHIFPEIYIIRSDLVQRVSTFTHPLAYWAFVQVAEYANFGKVLFRKNPFYITVTRYFENEGDRGQFGHTEVQDHWDRYRGGLEYLVSRIPPQSLTPEKQYSLLSQIQKFICMRLHVALRLRIQTRRNPLDTYYLAARMKAMGYAELIPAPFDEIRAQAAVHHILHSNVASDVVEKIVCVGAIPKGIMTFLQQSAGTLPIVQEPGLNLSAHERATIVLAGSVAGLPLEQTQLAARQIRLFGIADLMQKFG